MGTFFASASHKQAFIQTALKKSWSLGLLEIGQGEFGLNLDVWGYLCFNSLLVANEVILLLFLCLYH